MAPSAHVTCSTKSRLMCPICLCHAAALSCRSSYVRWCELCGISSHFCIYFGLKELHQALRRNWIRRWRGLRAELLGNAGTLEVAYQALHLQDTLLALAEGSVSRHLKLSAKVIGVGTSNLQAQFLRPKAKPCLWSATNFAAVDAWAQHKGKCLGQSLSQVPR